MCVSRCQRKCKEYKRYENNRGQGDLFDKARNKPRRRTGRRTRLRRNVTTNAAPYLGQNENRIARNEMLPIQLSFEMVEAK